MERSEWGKASRRAALLRFRLLTECRTCVLRLVVANGRIYVYIRAVELFRGFEMALKESLTEMERVSVQLTVEAKRQIVQWASEANLKPGYFMSMALTVGARALARQLNPEQFMTAQVWQSLMQSMASNPEMMAALGDDAVKLQRVLDDPEKMKEVQAKLVEVAS